MNGWMDENVMEKETCFNAMKMTRINLLSHHVTNKSDKGEIIMIS